MTYSSRLFYYILVVQAQQKRFVYGRPRILSTKRKGSGSLLLTTGRMDGGVEMDASNPNHAQGHRQ